MPQRNLAVELLRKLLNDEIKLRGRKNRAQAKAFSEKLQDALNKYENRFVLPEETIKWLLTLAKELRASVRANLRRMIKRILRLNGYPPDKQETAVQTVIEQAETLCEEWVGE